MRRKLMFAFPLIVILLLLPFLLWRFEESHPYRVVIVDHTVVNDQYREHEGFTWLLQHEKMVHEDRTPYSMDEYYGFHHNTKPAEPLKIDGHPDLIYVADTYGVYKQDLEGNLEGARSGLVYGGMAMEDWQTIQKAHQGGKTLLIAEFNSLATPTRKDVRTEMEKDLGVTWSGWTGRYFPRLEDEEVPVWVRNNYEAQSGKKYDLEGPGLVFVHESDTIVILTEDEFKNQVWFDVNEAGAARFPGVNRTPYQYWFDIVVPASGTQVLAGYDIDVNETGLQKLNKYHIPTEFPAILAQDAKRTYYFAGDYADAKTNGWVTYKGITWLRAVKAGWTGQDEFYWRSYVPMMKQIFQTGVNAAPEQK